VARINAIAGIVGASSSRLLEEIPGLNDSFLGGITRTAGSIRFGLMPPAMGGQVGRAIKDLQGRNP